MLQVVKKLFSAVPASCYFCTLCILGNVVAGKLIYISILDCYFPVSTIICCATFEFVLACKRRGFSDSSVAQITVAGFISQLLFSLGVAIIGLVPSTSEYAHCYNTVLGTSFVFVLASLVAYAIAFWVQAILEFSNRWAQIASLLIVQGVDTAVFCLIGYGAGCGWLLIATGRIALIKTIEIQTLFKFVCMITMDSADRICKKRLSQ